jgi:molecular chaperone DnaK (HSP70)
LKTADQQPWPSSGTPQDKFAAAAPVRVADRSYPADQLLRRMVADRIADLTAQHRGQPPAQLVLSHPTRWPAAAVAALRAATDPLAASAGGLQLVPHAIAAAIAYATDHPLPDGAAVLVCDVGATTDEVFIVRRRGDHLAVLAPPAGPHTGGGDELDDAVLRLLDHHLNGAAADLDPPPLQTQIAAARLGRDCSAAKEALSTAETVELTAHLPGGPVAVALTRAELDHAVRPTVTMIGTAVRACLRQVDAAPVRAVILTGGSSRLPAVHDEIRAAAGGRAVHLDPHAAARGAAALGAAELNPDFNHAGEVGGRYGRPAPPDAIPSGDPQPAPRRLAPTGHLLAGSDASSWCALHPAPTGLPPLPSLPSLPSHRPIAQSAD